MKIAGSNVLVTGASSGIGAALAPLLAERGATVGIVARREDRLRQVLDQCLEHAPGSRLWVHDFADVEGSVRLAGEAWDALGGLDVVVHNAAMPKRRRVQHLTPEELDETMRVNFFSPTRMALALLPRMTERGSGMNVFVSSLGGRLGIIHETAYCASKFALCGWAESMYLDLYGSGIETRLVIPGPIDTEIWDREGSDAPIYDGPKEPPSLVAEAIAGAIEGDGFEVYSPDLKAVAEWKTANIDDFLRSVAAEMAPREDAGP